MRRYYPEMELNGPDDSFARWVQALCAIPLLLFGAVCVYFVYTSPFWSYFYIVRTGLGIGAFYYAFRCLRYAITGKGNVNRDDF